MRLTSAILLACAFLTASATQAQPNALTVRQAGLVTVAAFTANGDLPKLKIALNEALDAGLTINEIKEVLVQMYAYAGFPRSLNAINTFDEVVQQRKQQGKEDVAGRAPNPLPANKTSLELGDEIRTKLTGSTAVAGYARFVPIIDDFLKAHLFGDIFGRDNLDYQSREIATISALATLHGLQAQLRGHFNVGLNVGLSEAQLRSILSVLSARVDNERAEHASQLLEETLRARATPESKSVTASVASPTGRRPAERLIVTPPKIQVRAAPESNFTGSVSVASPFRATGEARLGGATVTFQSGARTHWHVHPLGQLLVVTEGAGWVQVEGEPVRAIKPGDVVWTAPGVKHWHGATSGSSMTHVAIAESIEGAAVQWLEPVSSSQYRAP
jgi:alkylhydroperoxidase/carboxymuconolactone decarboxylase family protein YurZ/quercetin dioxygenase-like cupin family protein